MQDTKKQVSREQASESPAKPKAPTRTLERVAEPDTDAAVSAAHRSLEGIYEDLLARLEEGAFTDRRKFIDDYVATMAKRDEMATLWTDPAFYQQIKRAIIDEFLPLYDKHCELRAREEQKMEKATWPTFVTAAIVICLGIELIVTEGRVFRPFLLVPSVIVDGLLGYSIWYLVNFRALAALRRINRGLLGSIKDLITRQNVSEQYDLFRSYAGGDILKAELHLLLDGYGTPAEFWRDYYKVRQADPTTVEEAAALGVERFHGFLELHVSGSLSEEARRQRFDALFLLAHKAFLLADRKNYVLKSLQAQLK